MRRHPLNSPQAAGRLLALLLIADGKVARCEMDVLGRLEAEAVLGLAPGELQRLVLEAQEDLPSRGESPAMMDETCLASLFAEVDDPALQHRVLRLAIAAAGADHQVAEAEAYLIGAAGWHWRLYRERKRPEPGDG
jgi:hypothetical protein